MPEQSPSIRYKYILCHCHALYGFIILCVRQSWMGGVKNIK